MGSGSYCRRAPGHTQEAQQGHQRERATHQDHPKPAAVFIHTAGNRRAKGATDEDAGHVQRVQAAAAVSVEGIDGALAEDHIHLHAQILNMTPPLGQQTPLSRVTVWIVRRGGDQCSAHFMYTRTILSWR